MLTQKLHVLTAMVVLLSLSSSASAQEVRLVKKPAPQVLAGQSVVYDDWSVSYSRRSGPRYSSWAGRLSRRATHARTRNGSSSGALRSTTRPGSWP